ncbi:MAG: saccharopine dehydrogenase NADP-binding domain-containing protein, partial [Acidobacteriota bacterium]
MTHWSVPENTSWMIYGANGYTGELIAREAVSRGHHPILAGRSREAVETLADELECDRRVFPLDAHAATFLDGVAAVIHCAGPFSATSDPMVRACLGSGTHYLDITGEIAVFESIFRLQEEAQSAGVALIPGVGFDVVPTDCLAAMLSQALRSATELALAFYPRGGGISRGTLRTMIEGLPHGGAIRRDGRIVSVPVAFDSRTIPFSCGERSAMTIPWGDVATAYRTTGIRNIRVYSAASRSMIRRLRWFAPVMQVLRFKPLMKLAQTVAARRTGPDQSSRDQGRSYLWGEVRHDSGSSVSLTMETPEGYQLTAMSAVRALEHVLQSRVSAGTWT